MNTQLALEDVIQVNLTNLMTSLYEWHRRDEARLIVDQVVEEETSSGEINGGIIGMPPIVKGPTLAEIRKLPRTNRALSHDKNHQRSAASRQTSDKIFSTRFVLSGQFHLYINGRFRPVELSYNQFDILIDKVEVDLYPLHGDCGWVMFGRVVKYDRISQLDAAGIDLHDCDCAISYWRETTFNDNSTCDETYAGIMYVLVDSDAVVEREDVVKLIV